MKDKIFENQLSKLCSQEHQIEPTKTNTPKIEDTHSST